jgi:Dickkopf N-terminal cysteine-rich region
MVYVRFVRSLACLVIFVGCSYSDPDLDDTRFRCAGDSACPNGNICVNAVCVVPSHDGVGCMTETCAPGKQCCIDGTNAPFCIAATETCLGRFASCDGEEDCASGTVCCADGVDLHCTAEARCGRAACLQDADCPSTAKNCCADTFDSVPWKACSPSPC